MSRFVFSLQNVLNIKQKLEDAAKQEFSVAKLALDKEEEKLQSLRVRKSQYLAYAEELLQGSLRVREIEENQNAVKVMEDYIEEQKKVVLMAQRNLDTARFRLSEASKERKTYEILREKAFEEFLQEEKRAEGKSIDELVSYTYTQKRVGNM